MNVAKKIQSLTSVIETVACFETCGVSSLVELQDKSAEFVH